MKEIKRAIVLFKNPINFYDTELLRGAIAGMMKNENDILFHNHVNECLRYHYPLVQYKRIEGNAALFGIKEGVDSVIKFISKQENTIMLGQKQVVLQTENINIQSVNIGIGQKRLHYSLSQWLPFNRENYHKYQEIEGLQEKIIFLQNILIGNILSFYKEMGEFVNDTILCTITSMSETQLVKYKGTTLNSINITFLTNANLPEFTGLGKGVSIGFGLLKNYIPNPKNQEPV